MFPKEKYFMKIEGWKENSENVMTLHVKENVKLLYARVM
jgi:hypothetical protein